MTNIYLFSVTVENKCGGEIALGSNRSITFAHPDWPLHYTADRLCTWHITADENQSISIWFHAFSVEMGYKCEFDHLRLSISANFTSSSLKYCGLLGKNNGPPFQKVLPILFVITSYLQFHFA